MELTQEEIITGTKVIAEFMDSLTVDMHGNIKEDLTSFKYHSSWDWLMPVLEKIQAKGHRWEIGMSPYSSLYHYCKIWSIGTIEKVSLLDAVYSAVLEFIKWYNSNN